MDGVRRRARLTLLGEVALRTAEGALVALPGRRGAALVAYLALEADRAHDRAALAALLWPRAVPAAARGALRQALFALRRRLDETRLTQVLVAEARSVRLDPAGLEIDAHAVEAAPSDTTGLRARRDLCGADLLAGLAAPGPAYARWMEARRAAFAERASASFAALLTAEIEAERWDEALATARALLRAEPTAERAALGAMRALAALGDPDAALTVRDALVERRRAAGLASPGPAVHELAARLAPRRSAAPDASRTAPRPRADEATGEDDRHPALLLVVRVDPAVPGPRRRDRLDAASAAAGHHGGLVVRREPDCAAIAFGARGLGAREVERALEGTLALARAADGMPAPPRVALVVSALRTTGEVTPWAPAADIARAVAAADRARPGTPSVEAAVARMAGAEAMSFAPADEPGLRTLDGRHAPRLGRFAFVGRACERAQLDALVEATLAERRARVVRLCGEPGIGKTRLARETLALAQVRGADAVEVALPAEAAAAEGWLLRRIGEALDPAGAVPLADHGAEAGERAALRRAGVTEALRRRAAARPVAIFLDQIEGVSPADADELAALVAASPEAGVLWLLAGRPPERGEADAILARLAGRLPTTSIKLAPLAPAEAAAFATALAIAPARRDEVLRRAGGNPLFLEQLLLHLGEGAGETPPPSVVAAVQARLAHLGAAERAALRALAVLGPGAPRALIERLTGAGAPALAALEARGFLREAAGRLAHAHPLIAESVLDAMAPAERRALHARAAQATAEDPARRARHLEAAGEPGAAAAFLAASTARCERRDYAEAAALAERGRALAPPPALAAALSLALGRALLDLGDPERALEAFEAAAFAAVDPAARAEARIACAGAHRILDRIDDGLAVLDAAERRLPGEARTLAAELDLQRGRLLFARGEAGASTAAHARALEVALDPKDDDRAALALGGLADAAYAEARMEDAAVYVERSLALCAGARDPRIATAQRSLYPHLQIYRGRTGEALALARAASEEAAGLGARRAEINARLGVAAAGFLLGRHDECRAACEAVLALVARSGARRFEAVAQLYLARLELAVGRPDAARRLVERARAGAEATGRPVYAAQAVALLAATARTAAEARAWLSEATRLIEAGALAHNALRVHPNAAWIFLRFGEREAAKASAARLAAVAPGGQCRWIALYAAAIGALLGDDAGERARLAGASRAAGYLPLAGALEGTSPAGAGVIA